MDWFRENPKAFRIKHSEFTKLVKNGDICDLTLVSDKSKGFLVAGHLSGGGNSACVLVNSENLLRYIKSPDKAHDYLYQLGVENFQINTFSWDVEKALKKSSKSNRAHRNDGISSEYDNSANKQQLQNDNDKISNEASEQEANLIALNERSYKVKQQEFIKMYENGDICDLALVSNKSEGFFIVGKLKRDDKGIHRCILVKQHGQIRYIKSPDFAHEFMYSLGVKGFSIDTLLWDEENVFNPHKVSFDSRIKKRNRDIALQSKGAYVEKLREFCCLDKGKIAEVVHNIAPGDKHVKEIMGVFEKGQIPNYISDKLIVKFIHFLTEEGIFPQNHSEAVVFGYFWDISSEKSMNEVVDKMPISLIEYLSKRQELNRLVKLSIEDRLKRESK